MDSTNFLRYDTKYDRYFHREDGQPGKYNGLSKDQAAVRRWISKEERKGKTVKTAANHVEGWTPFKKSHLIGA